jgi:hypothetical protein
MDIHTLGTEEYKSLRGEISALVAESRKLELLAIGGVAATYAWFVTSKVPPGAAWYVPALLPLLGALRAYAIFKRIGEIGDYLRNIEKSLDWSGWETHFATKLRSRVSFTSIVLWLALLAFTLLAPQAAVGIMH